MRLVEALELARRGRERSGELFTAYLSCGFTPLHLETFLAAHLAEHLANRQIQTRHGLYGGLVYSILSAAEQTFSAAFVAIEWSDLDIRLGIRQLGGWGETIRGDILEGAQLASSRIQQAIQQLAARTTVVAWLPTIPIPPVSPTPSGALGGFEAALYGMAANLASSLAQEKNVRVVHPERVALLSPPANRWNARADLNAGLPYSNSHCDAVARAAVEVLLPSPPRKGIITDLDDTLWNGIVGEVGPANVTWTLEGGAAVHGLYQQLLASLAEQGTLLVIASKNEPGPVAEALDRKDLLLPRRSLFPVEAH